MLYRCSHHIEINADRRRDHVRLSDIELGFACTRSGAFAASRAIGNDWADRFPAIVEAAARLKALSFLIDGEAGIARDDRTPGAARWSKGQ